MKKLLLTLLLGLGLGPPAVLAQLPASPISGTITATGCMTVPVGNKGTVTFQVTGGTWTGTIQPQGVIDGNAAFNIQVIPFQSTTPQNTITANGIYTLTVAGLDSFKLCGNTVTNTATVKGNAVQVVSKNTPGGFAPAGVTSLTGDGTVFNNSASTGAVTLTLTNAPSGTGALLLQTSPTLITPLLGTPTSGVLTNTTGYKWDKIADPGANQILTMTGFSSTWNWGATNTNKFSFDTTGNPTFGLVSATTAVTNSPTITIQGSYQNAGTPTFASDIWTIQNVIGSGTNGTSTLTFGHSGSSGAHQYSFQNVSAGALTLQLGSGTGAGLGVGSGNGIGLYAGTNLQALFGDTSNVFQMASGGVWVFTSGTVTGTKDTGVSRGAAGIVVVGTGTAGSKVGFILSGNTVFVTTNFTTAANTNLQTITGLSWTVPAVAFNYGFDCDISYSQATGAAAVAFGIQAATNNPTNIYATGTQQITAGPPGTFVTGTLATLATTTATAIVTGTPGAQATNYNVHLGGTIENPASANTFNIMVSTATSGDAVTVLRGSTCHMTP